MTGPGRTPDGTDRRLDATQRTRLADERVGWLCTLRPDGSPHLTPVWFVCNGSTVWVATASSTVKACNISRDPRVSFALQDGDAPLVGEGRAQLFATGEAPDAVVAGFAAKYGWSIGEPESDGRPPVVLGVRVDRWLLDGTAR